MTERQREIISLAGLVTAAATTATLVGWKAGLGFVLGICATFIAAAIVGNGDFD